MKKLLVLSCILLVSCGQLPLNGLNSLIKLTSTAPTCASGGVTVISALDANRSNDVELDVDTNVQMAAVCNGGSNTGPFSSVEILNPCGDDPTRVDEVLLRLSDGTVLASFSDNASGSNTRFSLIGPGTYSTTDGTGCTFTLTSDGRLL